TKSRILIYDPQLSKISVNVQNEINSQRPQSLNIFQLPNNLKNDAIDYFAPDLKLDENPYEKIIAIFHSSGSTSFPKLVPLSNRYLLNAVKSNHTREIILSIAPLFHIYGFVRALKYILGPGSTYAFPIVAGSIPLANEVLHSLKQSNARILHTLPATLEQISKYYPEEIKTLLNLKSIFYSGAALFPQVGEQLVQSGVKIRNSYGATEIGNLMLTPENLSPDIPWNAMKLIVPESNIEWIERNDILDGAKELVLKKSSSILANIKGNTDNDDYRVGDLFIEVKKGSGLYLLLGRVDDTLIHTTGEKTNPVPMEDTIRLNKFVRHAIVIGHNRPFNCLLIELDFDHLKNTPFLEITKSIFDSVHQANINCPSHSRIFDEMVYILPLEGKMLPRTMKNNIQRKKAEIEFKEEIEMLYDNLVNRRVVSNENSFSDNQWDENSVKTTILSSLKLAIGDSFLKITEYETSLFALGLDSLSATKLRAILQNKFSFIDLPYDAVFEHNTVQSLTHYLIKELSKINVSQNQYAKDGYEEKLQALKDEVNSYIKKYNKIDNFPSMGFVNGITGINGYGKDGETVLITGATGSLGSFILRDLLRNPNVLKVYCLVRASDENNGWFRLKDSFEQRHLDTSLLSKERVIILPSDLGDSKLGQTEKVYLKLVREITQIYHVAWRLDFNSKIEVFERECIGGTVNLLMLARDAYINNQNIHFNFTSSISTSLRSKINVKEDELPQDISNAILNGYGLSKFITEHVCAEWSRKIGFKLDIHRVGQVCGDSVTGVWNTKEHISLMIKGAQIMKIMPDSYTSNVDWIPVDVASQSIVDISLNAPFDDEIDYVRVNHILNPKRITWNEFLKFLNKSGIDFKIVSNKEWLNTLLKTPEYQNVDKNPVAALSGFFEKTISESSNKSEEFETHKSVDRSLALSNCQKID
ncbi:3735_t:CDS:1, partial [Racocetra persica]